MGSVAIPLAATGLLGAALAIPLAAFLAEGRATVETFLTIAFLALPLALVAQVLLAVANGLEAWRSIIVSRLIPPLLGVVGIVTLYVTDALTVASAATITIVSSLLSVVPLVLGVRPWRYTLRLRAADLREGSVFGLKAWITQVGSSANARLDQLLMIRLVSSQELGLYAVGVNAAAVAPLFTTALAVPLSVRVAKGETEIAARALRTTLAFCLGVAIALCAIVPIFLPLLFGSAFSQAVEMAQILVVASVPLAGRGVLTSALTAAGRPGAGAVSQLAALALTVPALLLVLPEWGGVGAAVVSLVAYSVTFLILLLIARSHFSLGMRALLVPTRADLRWGVAQVRSAMSRARRRGSSSEAERGATIEQG
jgi:O-antigen/teichoic acid export membrane protein